MNRRGVHLADEELVALTYTSGADADARDGEALAHAAACVTCGRRLADLSATIADLRRAAHAEADAQFPEAVLERQRRQILARIEHLGQRARVLRFPVGPAAPQPAVVERPPARRWLAAAVAAGLFGGFLLAESLHLLPGDAGRFVAERAASGAETVEIATIEDDEFLSEVEAALLLGRSPELRALDALTPVSYGIR
jgi:anti-sigma factor RsiW